MCVFSRHFKPGPYGLLKIAYDAMCRQQGLTGNSQLEQAVCGDWGIVYGYVNATLLERIFETEDH